MDECERANFAVNRYQQRAIASADRLTEVNRDLAETRKKIDDTRHMDPLSEARVDYEDDIIDSLKRRERVLEMQAEMVRKAAESSQKRLGDARGWAEDACG